VRHLTVVGNPDNRRVGLFRAAVRAAGLPDPVVVSWLDVLTGRHRGFVPGSLVRIDSPGEDAEVDRRLREADRPLERGEINGTAAWYRGLLAALDRLGAQARASDATLVPDPAAIAVLFDKRACHARLEQAGIPVPPALPSPSSYLDLKHAMAAAGWNRVFVKPAHGSSASGVIALRVAGPRVLATTSIERAGDRLFNSLRVRDYRDEAVVASMVDRLAPDGLHVERWFPKAGLGGRVVDLRVAVVAGRASHVVVRASRSPMTNLHLGGARGDLAALRAAAGKTAYRCALRTCERVAALFPGCLQVGVDLMFAPDWRRHAVAEVNAFGDLLPGLLAGGRDTYAEQVAALQATLAELEQPALQATLAEREQPARQHEATA
jgi:glutathione synthase/RimK-type ligase-like ATP-grasp enzyme